MNKITLNNATIDIDELTTEQRNQLLDALTPNGIAAKRELWTPKIGETYWILNEDHGIRDYIWNDDSADHAWLAVGNVFPTREYAEAARRHREAQSVIDRYCYAKGIDTRWKDGVEQWGIYITSGDWTFSRYTNTCDGSPFCVESKEIAQQIIADCADEIRTVLLRGWV